MTRRLGKGESPCPDGTHAGGYTLDSWGKTVCLSILSVKDLEDVYIMGFLFFGGGVYLAHCEIGKMSAAVLAFERLSRTTNWM